MHPQKLHLVRQDTAIAQDKVFPNARHIRGIKQGHARLLGCSGAFAVVAVAARRHQIHPCVAALLAHWNDVFTRQHIGDKAFPAVRTHIAITGKQFGVGQPRRGRMGVATRDTTGANDAVHLNTGLQPCDGIIAAVKDCHLRPERPAHIVGRVVQHRLFQGNP